MTYLGLSGFCTGQAGLQLLINEMNSKNLNVLRLGFKPSWYSQAGTSAPYSKELIQYYLDNCPYDIIVDRNHIWMADLAAAATDFRAHLAEGRAGLLQVCADFPNNPRVLIELCNEYNAADHYTVMQGLIDDIRGAGYANRIVENWYGYAYPYRWTQFSEPVIQGNHIYFNNPTDKTNYAISIMNEAAAAGIEVINTEIGSNTGEYPQFTAASVAAVKDFMQWCFDRGIGNCLWYYRDDVSNLPYYYNLGFTWPALPPTVPDPYPGNLARLPEDWGLEYGPLPTIIKVDPYFTRTPGRPSIRLDPHTAADVNTAREVNSNVHPPVKAGDHVVFRCWMATNPSELEPPDPTNPVSLYAGARIGIDFYGDDPASGKNGYITGIATPTLPRTDEGVLENYVHWGTPDWTLRTIEFDVPVSAISELNGQAYPVTALLPWLQCWSSTYAGNDPTLAWFADAELYIVPFVPPSGRYVCPFENQEFNTAEEAIAHLNAVHYPSPTLQKWVIEFKPWPMP